MFKTFDEIVEDLMLYKLDTVAVNVLRKMAESELIELHKLTGDTVRREYRLWDNSNPVTMLNYIPNMSMGVDVNPKHPEAMSYSIIRTIWKRLQ